MQLYTNQTSQFEGRTHVYKNSKIRIFLSVHLNLFHSTHAYKVRSLISTHALNNPIQRYIDQFKYTIQLPGRWSHGGGRQE